MAGATGTRVFSGRARINYLSTMRFDEEFLAAIESVGDDVEVRQVSVSSAEEIDDEVWAQVDVLHTGSVVCHPSRAPRLRWVQVDTSGVDHLRSEPLWDSDIPITTIGGVSPVPLAEYVMWAVLGTAHRLPALLETRERRRWPGPDERWARMLPAPVRGATLGILGYGRIGREIGRLGRVFGMDVLAVRRTPGSPARAADHYDPSAELQPSADAPVQVFGPDGLHEVLGRSDYLVVVLPLTEQTAGMLDAQALGALKDSAVIINVARGGIVDEDALRAALRSGRVRAAVLDVFADEPLAPDDPWWDEPNVLVTPHVSGLAPAYAEQVLEIVSQNLRRLREGRSLLNVVDRTLGY
ncbi:phosphoglycerate dehydrogenase-like enzyme [Motilibacter peucedani]|uniref:Phosphoglycerate dehydrogenase-like enzyme n=1 Tax=Motilibacter peucedani TaxID=598650 RepID=A0A420XMI0_9ACTN|nr:D-2-hydroxyacid dehydrogenase [Motilibacter peucedani]RKS72485.1 phosphoglycerate dehydrogenase-like enzyme [Motilibacter peucedani]